MIPEAAVEAAAKAQAVLEYESNFNRPVKEPDVLWSLWGMDSETMEDYRRLARAALEAAAPHMRRSVDSHGELEFMPVDSVVFSEDTAYQYHGAGNWAGDGRFYDTEQIGLPVVVLHEPVSK